MKKILYFGALFALAAVAVVFALLYQREASLRSPGKVFASNRRQWLLSGESHLFDITERTFDTANVFGYAEGLGKWTPVGGPKAQFSPYFLPIGKNVTLTDTEYVIGVVNGGVSTAYPLKVLASHQVVNDSAQQPPVLVYFGNSSRTAAAFNADDTDVALVLGSSGYLYDNVDLLYDGATESFFLPVTGMFVSGEKVGRKLASLPCAVMPLAQWRALHPDSRLMSDNTGVRNVSYPRQDVLAAPFTLKMPLRGVSDSYAPAAPVIVLVDGDDSVAVPFPAAKALGKTQYSFSFGGHDYVARFADDWNTAWITDPAGTLQPSVRTVWQVYAALFPKGAVATLK